MIVSRADCLESDGQIRLHSLHCCQMPWRHASGTLHLLFAELPMYSSTACVAGKKGKTLKTHYALIHAQPVGLEGFG